MGVPAPTYVYADVCVYKNMCLCVLTGVRREPHPPAFFLGHNLPLLFFSRLAKLDG